MRDKNSGQDERQGSSLTGSHNTKTGKVEKREKERTQLNNIQIKGDITTDIMQTHGIIKDYYEQ